MSCILYLETAKLWIRDLSLFSSNIKLSLVGRRGSHLTAPPLKPDMRYSRIRLPRQIDYLDR